MSVFVPTIDEIVKDAVANSRLEGCEVDEETLAVTRLMASGEMSDQEFEEWERRQAEKIEAEFAPRARTIG